MEILTAPLQIGTDNMGFSAQFPTKKGPGNLTPKFFSFRHASVFKTASHYNLCGQLQRCQMPDIENSRKTAEKGAEWVTAKQPKNSRKNTRNTRKTAVLTVFRVFRVFFRLFFGCFAMTHSAPFSAVFRLFSMSGIWHLCSWPQSL